MGLDIYLKIFGVRSKRIVLSDSQMLLTNLIKQIKEYSFNLQQKYYYFIFNGQLLPTIAPGISLAKLGFKKNQLNKIILCPKIIAQQSKVFHYKESYNQRLTNDDFTDENSYTYSSFDEQSDDDDDLSDDYEQTDSQLFHYINLNLQLSELFSEDYYITETEQSTSSKDYY
ncbi:hypothetical protein SS50377_27687 [Spironucleus salmonicida]|uniref:Ubiquitin-like domain-containing protein n=1 Tax=Spironucleus salmonicida TaxID=348837 RepID=V6LPD2_9EUKA|nr:hypothetical protein SS50377_27687 [Spironucleus salmonicida]|eukprot:EST46537.1 Hypothetical protein SS50377_13342 [Spironucleus salmonicida]